MPGAARQRIILKGDVPSPSNPPSGCRFHTRCPYVFDGCRTEEPALRPIADGQFAACHLNDLLAAQNPMAGDASVLLGGPARGDNGADTARGVAVP
jgi:peptide/nickel transport system ATP-binding protein